MSEFVTFGSPARFEIAFKWRRDDEPRSRRPAAHGWSTGDLRITVANQVLTQNTRGDKQCSEVSWYLSPIFDWLVSNWLSLLHEEGFDWPEHSGSPAAVACRKTMYDFIAADDEAGREIYRTTQAWYFRHGLRSAAEGGLFPDIFIRRLVDDIEVSWLSTAPQFAAEDFVFLTDAGSLMLPVGDVAKPLWEALRWFAQNPPKQIDDKDRESWQQICNKINNMENTSLADMEAAFLESTTCGLLEKFRNSRKAAAGLFTSEQVKGIPALQLFSPAVAMFGGVSPDLGRGDVDKIFDVMASQYGGEDTEKLAGIVKSRGKSPLGVPHADGYSLAEDFLEDEAVAQPVGGWVDIRGIVKSLGIEVEEDNLVTNSIRGVAIAGDGFSPKILVNLSSAFNSSENGRRFTIAHELCHILHDRSRARRVTHVSGEWVPPGFEKRANAFAARLLMPRNLVISAIGERRVADLETVREIAQGLRVSETALVRHLHNLRLIKVWERDELQAAMDSGSDS